MHMYMMSVFATYLCAFASTWGTQENGIDASRGTVLRLWFRYSRHLVQLGIVPVIKWKTK